MSVLHSDIKAIFFLSLDGKTPSNKFILRKILKLYLVGKSNFIITFQV